MSTTLENQDKRSVITELCMELLEVLPTGEKKEVERVLSSAPFTAPEMEVELWRRLGWALSTMTLSDDVRAKTLDMWEKAIKAREAGNSAT